MVVKMRLKENRRESTRLDLEVARPRDPALMPIDRPCCLRHPPDHLRAGHRPSREESALCGLGSPVLQTKMSRSVRPLVLSFLTLPNRNKSSLFISRRTNMLPAIERSASSMPAGWVRLHQLNNTCRTSAAGPSAGARGGCSHARN